MTSTFLHEDKIVPPDEMLEKEAPPCPRCSQQMSLTRVDTQLSDTGIKSKRDYECIRCGAKTSVCVIAHKVSSSVEMEKAR